MRKVFLNAAALSLALLTVSPALQSCKDYDDDITNINCVTDDIAKQILDLQKQVDNLSEAQKNALDAAANAATAAEAARKLAEEALQAGNKAEADALAAQAMASDAKSAAEKAKADMLDALTKEAQALKDLIGTNSSDIKSATEKIAQNAAAIAELDGKIAAVDAKLANYSTTADMVAAINKAISDNNADINSKIDAETAKILEQVNALASRTTAIETQQATLQGYITSLQSNYTELSGKIDGLSNTIKTQQQSIEGLSNDLTEIKGQLENLKTTVAGFETKLNEIDTKLTTISSKVSTLENELNTLTTVLLPGRLSSVTLVPNLYIGGIPTIEFMTISYNQWEADAEKAGIYNVTENKFEITSNDAIAHYRLNPSTVGDKDIKLEELSFVSSRAVSRAESEPTLNVSKAAINDGILDVWVKNNNAGKLSDDAKKEITIAALRVPIANEHLYENEKTTGASVYSEYSRVAESYITPIIKAIPSSDIEGYDLTQYDLEQFADNSNIDAALNGNDFVAVDVVYNGDGQNLLEIVEGQYNNNPVIVVSKDELNAWGLDFEFVLFGKELCPDAEYASIDGTTIKAIAPEDAKLSDAIGKTPWIAALLKDVENDQIIDVQYVQVKFVQDIRPVEETFTASIPLFCGEKEISVDWDWMKENILSKLNATNDMTPEEFISIYTDTKIVAVAPNGDDVEANLVAVYDPETEAYKWTITSAELDMSKLENQVFEGSVVCKDPKELYPTVTVNIDITVEISEKDMPSLNTGSIYWADAPDKLQYILAYPTDPRSASSNQVAEYNTNILQGRLAPYISNMLDCALWGTYFNDSKYNDEENRYVWFTTEYSDPATFTNGELPATKPALEGLSLNFWIENNEDGIAMVQNEEKVLIDWKANLVGNSNSNDAPTFGQCWVYVKQPLYYKQIKALDITDNVGASVTCDLTNSWEVTDYYNNIVVNTESYNYRDFYVLENIVYNVDDAFMTKTASATSDVIGKCSDYKVTVSIENNTLTYTNMGAILLEECYIQIPVSLPHRWGVLNGTISVKLNPIK